MILPCAISMFSVCFILTNIPNRTWKAQDQALCHMLTVWPDSSVVRVHVYSGRVLGSNPGRGRVMGAGGGGGVNVALEEKAYDQTRSRIQHLLQTLQIL